jgi:TonB-linked SusC/RagA family outer membrane protein
MINFYLMRKRSLWYLGLVFLLAFSALVAQGQSVTITGKVTDAETQQGLPGASVLVVGTTTGTITDADGNFSLNVNASSSSVKVTISFIGYASANVDVQIANGSTAPINVALQPDIRSLDEVVVVGSTLQSTKRQLGNTINSVSAKDLEKSGTGNLFGALQGKIPGAQITQNSGDPAGGMTIRLRGVKSLSGNSDPLYVIDGVVSSNSTTNVSQTAVTSAGVSLGTNRMADINPNDVESINILNGAAAAAIYGSRAINGVVVITTKRGKSGKPKFTFSTSFNTNELRKKVPFTTYGKQFWSATQVQHTIANVGSPTTPNSIFVEGNTNGDRYVGTSLVDVTRYDYQDQIFRAGSGTDNYFSVTGGNDKTSYLASASYMKNEGIIKGTDFQRYGVRLRLDQTLSNWAKLSMGLAYNNSSANEKPNGNVFYSPINSVTITNNTYDIAQRDAFGNLQAVDGGRVNPLTVIETFNFSQKVNRAIADVQLKLAPIKGLNVDLLAGLDTYSEQGLNYIPAYTYTTNSGNYPTGFASSAANQAFLMNFDFNTTYERDFGDFKSISTLGFNYQYNRSDFTSASGQGISTGIKTVSGATTNLATVYDLSQFNIYGGFLQHTLGYKNFAFLTLSGRIDGSSKFEKNSTDQFYGKVSGSLVVSDLDFWKQSLGSSVNSFKVRAAFGDAGGLNAIGPYSRFQNVTGGQFLNKGAFTASNRVSNPNIKPERMRELEVGADLGILGDRFSVGFTWYKQEISDLIVDYVVASSTGGTSKLDNVGTMVNTGIELALGASVVKTTDWGWDINLIYSRNRNTVNKLGSPRIQIANDTGAPVWHVEGQPASVFFGTYFARDDSGNILLNSSSQFYQERGNATTNVAERDPATGVPYQTGTSSGLVRKVIGNPNPDYTASVSTSVRYKNLTFSALLDAVQGFSVFNADRRTRQGIGNGEYAEKELKGELPRGYIWSMYSVEEWRIEDGSFVKLREMSLSYNLPPIIKGISNLQLSLTGRNLYSWDSYGGYDPETNAGNNSDRFRATDFGNVPIPRSYQVKLVANF